MTDRSLHGAKILLTGASAGIGAATALTLAREGAELVLLARRSEVLAAVLARALAAGAHPGSYFCSVDLEDGEAAESAALQAWDRLGHLDGFVSNAALLRRRRAPAIPAAELEQHLRVNFLAPARMSLALASRMIERGDGTIVMVGSVAGRIGAPGELSYVASKHALAGFTESLAVDTLGTGLRVRLLTLGPFDTEIWQENGGEPTHYAGVRHPPSLAATSIVDLLTGRQSGYETFVPEQAAQTVRSRFQDVDAFITRAAAMTTPHA